MTAPSSRMSSKEALGTKGRRGCKRHRVRGIQTGVLRGTVLAHRWPGRAFKALLVSRPNRFLAICETEAGLFEAHVPDRGRCLDLLVPGREVGVVAAEGPLRRTKFTWLLARSSMGAWVSLDPAGAPRPVEEALRLGMLAT